MSEIGWNGRKDLISVKPLSRRYIENVLDYSVAIEPYSGKGNNLGICHGENMITAFFEPSTRTRMSFDIAMSTLGGTYDHFYEDRSSMKKGESIKNTIKTLENYSDIIVMRHYQQHIIEELAKEIKIPLINAGDGINEHPTQALVDLYTIRKHLKRLDGLTIVTIGDLHYNRPAHSMNLALDKFDNMKIYAISPPGLESQEEYKPKRNKYEEIRMDPKKLDETIWEINPDVICTWRLRKEYIEEDELKSWDRCFITKRTMSRTKPSGDMVVTHPMPLEEGAEEISPEIMNDPRVVPFKQERYGDQVRMVLLALGLGHEDKIRSVGTPWFKVRYAVKKGILNFFS